MLSRSALCRQAGYRSRITYSHLEQVSSGLSRCQGKRREAQARLVTLRSGSDPRIEWNDHTAVTGPLRLRSLCAGQAGQGHQTVSQRGATGILKIDISGNSPPERRLLSVSCLAQGMLFPPLKTHRIILDALERVPHRSVKSFAFSLTSKESVDFPEHNASVVM